MALVHTTAGLLPEEELEHTTQTVEETVDRIVLAREWFHKGNMVRRDVWVTLKRGFEVTPVAKL